MTFNLSKPNISLLLKFSLNQGFSTINEFTVDDKNCIEFDKLNNNSKKKLSPASLVY